MANAKWSIDPKSIKTTVAADGTVTISASLLDNGVKQITPTLTITPDRMVRLLVHGEPGATLSGFEAWSDF